MAYGVTALQNFQSKSRTSASEAFYLPGDPGVSFVRGELCSFSGGVLIKGTDSAANALFRVAESTVCPAASQAFVKPADMHPRRKESKDLTLVPVEALVAEGAPILLANLSGVVDEAVISYTASTRAVALTTGFAADDRPNGALAYVYEGPGIGEVNIIEDYDHAGGAANLLAIFHRAFQTTLTANSRLAILATTGSDNAVSCFGRVDLADEDEVDVNDGTDDGDFVIYADWQNLNNYLRLGQVPVINRMHLFS